LHLCVELSRLSEFDLNLGGAILRSFFLRRRPAAFSVVAQKVALSLHRRIRGGD
jgi:hypothetical protein